MLPRHGPTCPAEGWVSVTSLAVQRGRASRSSALPPHAAASSAAAPVRLPKRAMPGERAKHTGLRWNRLHTEFRPKTLPLLDQILSTRIASCRDQLEQRHHLEVVELRIRP